MTKYRDLGRLSRSIELIVHRLFVDIPAIQYLHWQ
jgi:hypothetical protein